MDLYHDFKREKSHKL